MEVKLIPEAEPRAHTKYGARNLPQPRVSKEREIRGGVSSQNSLKPVTSIAWSCDGRILATGSQERQIRIWNTLKFDVAHSSVLCASVQSPQLTVVGAMAFSPTEPEILVASTKIASASAKVNTPNTVTVWDTTKLNVPLATFNLPANSLRIAFHPSGRQFAVVCEHGVRDQALFYWLGPHGPDGAECWALREDIHLGCAGVVLGVHFDELHSLTFSHSGKVIFTGSANGGLNSWKFRETAPAPRSKALSNGTSVPLPRARHKLVDDGGTETPNSPRSRTPTGGDEEGTAVDEAESGKVTGDGDVEMQADEPATSTGAVDVTAETVSSGEPTSQTEVDGVGGELVAKSDAMEMDGVVPTKEAPASGVQTPAARSRASSPKAEGSVANSAEDAWAKQLTVLRHTPVHYYNCYAIGLCPTGRFIATGGADGMINLLSTKDWIGVKTFLSMPGNVDHLTFSHDGEFLAANGDDQTIFILSPHTGTTIHRIPTSGPVNSLAWSPIKNTLAYSTKPLTNATSASWWYVEID